MNRCEDVRFRARESSPFGTASHSSRHDFRFSRYHWTNKGGIISSFFLLLTPTTHSSLTHPPRSRQIADAIPGTARYAFPRGKSGSPSFIHRFHTALKHFRSLLRIPATDRDIGMKQKAISTAQFPPCPRFWRYNLSDISFLTWKIESYILISFTRKFYKEIQSNPHRIRSFSFSFFFYQLTEILAFIISRKLLHFVKRIKRV